jgi:hypothetical protein
LGRAIYARFEQIIALVLIVLIAVVVVVAILDFSKEVLFLAWHGFVNPLDSKMLRRIFGQIMTVLIALEFKRVASPEVTPISTELDGHSPSGAISSNFFGCVCLARMKTPPRGTPRGDGSHIFGGGQGASLVVRREDARWVDGKLTADGLQPLPLDVLAKKTHELGLVTGAVGHTFNRWQWALHLRSASIIPCKWAAASSMSRCLYCPALLSAESTPHR